MISFVAVEEVCNFEGSRNSFRRKIVACAPKPFAAKWLWRRARTRREAATFCCCQLVRVTGGGCGHEKGTVPPKACLGKCWGKLPYQLILTSLGVRKQHCLHSRGRREGISLVPRVLLFCKSFWFLFRRGIVEVCWDVPIAAPPAIEASSLIRAFVFNPGLENDRECAEKQNRIRLLQFAAKITPESTTQSWTFSGLWVREDWKPIHTRDELIRPRIEQTIWYEFVHKNQFSCSWMNWGANWNLGVDTPIGNSALVQFVDKFINWFGQFVCQFVSGVNSLLQELRHILKEEIEKLLKQEQAWLDLAVCVKVM